MSPSSKYQLNGVLLSVFVCACTKQHHRMKLYSSSFSLGSLEDNYRSRSLSDHSASFDGYLTFTAKCSLCRARLDLLPFAHTNLSPCFRGLKLPSQSMTANMIIVLELQLIIYYQFMSITLLNSIKNRVFGKGRNGRWGDTATWGIRYNMC